MGLYTKDFFPSSSCSFSPLQYSSMARAYKERGHATPIVIVIDGEIKKSVYYTKTRTFSLLAQYWVSILRILLLKIVALIFNFRHWMGCMPPLSISPLSQWLAIIVLFLTCRVCIINLILKVRTYNTSRLEFWSHDCMPFCNSRWPSLYLLLLHIFGQMEP